MYINGLAKGTDSDNVRHSGPDTSLDLDLDLLSPRRTVSSIEGLSHVHDYLKVVRKIILLHGLLYRVRL